MNRIIIAYVPVIHKGYLELFWKYPGAEVFVIDPDCFKNDFPQLKKDLRALNSRDIVLSLRSLFQEKKLGLTFHSVSQDCLLTLAGKFTPSDLEIIMPNEDISHELAIKYLSCFKITYVSVFLRYDKIKTMGEDPVVPDVIISHDELDRHFMNLAKKESQKSEDWWRQIGAVLVRKKGINSQVILARHNTHLPTSYSLQIYGDPRGNYSKGLNYEFSTAIHAEAGIVAEAAKRGISLNGASLYVSTFPCPPCVRLLALTGIEGLYFKSGYSVLEGQELLKQFGVKIIQVK